MFGLAYHDTINGSGTGRLQLEGVINIWLPLILLIKLPVSMRTMRIYHRIPTQPAMSLQYTIERMIQKIIITK